MRTLTFGESIDDSVRILCRASDGVTMVHCAVGRLAHLHQHVANNKMAVLSPSVSHTARHPTLSGGAKQQCTSSLIITHSGSTEPKSHLHPVATVYLPHCGNEVVRQDSGHSSGQAYAKLAVEASQGRMHQRIANLSRNQAH